MMRCRSIVSVLWLMAALLAGCDRDGSKPESTKPAEAAADHTEAISALENFATRASQHGTGTCRTQAAQRYRQIAAALRSGDESSEGLGPRFICAAVGPSTFEEGELQMFIHFVSDGASPARVKSSTPDGPLSEVDVRPERVVRDTLGSGLFYGMAIVPVRRGSIDRVSEADKRSTLLIPTDESPLYVSIRFPDRPTYEEPLECTFSKFLNDQLDRAD
ncbi:MAG TPA: hypothetical protein VGN72_03355 [Tepidisphaeraceae bacterium]|nr:hypothetical protein [Tepidisphaeraceae bacterium]